MLSLYILALVIYFIWLSIFLEAPRYYKGMAAIMIFIQATDILNLAQAIINNDLNFTTEAKKVFVLFCVFLRP